MKAFGILILLVAVGFVGFQYAYEPIAEYIGLEKPKPPVIAVVEPTPVKVVVTPPPMVPKKVEPMPVVPTPPMPEPMPQITMTDTKLSAPIAVPDADGFMPPTFPPIEEVVKNWLEIPRGAFNPPRPVKVMKPVEFVRTIGGNKIASKVPAGGMAYVTGQDGLNLTIALTTEPGSPFSQVGMDDTDLKAVLTEAYERWKVNMTDYKRRQHQFAKDSSSRAAETKKAGVVAPASTGDAPKKNAEGQYDILLASMKVGQVTEITPTNIKKWGDAQLEKIDGKDYWTVIVDYTTKTMFGDFDTQAQARVFGGKVEKWIYTGSGEVVP